LAAAATGETGYPEGVVRNAAAIALHFVLSLAVILRVYRWETYSAFDFPKQVTILSYLLAAAIVTVITTGALLLPRRFRSSLGRLVAVLAVSCSALALVCIGFGPYGLNIPGTRLNGIFFSEWMFVSFFFYVGLPLAVAAAVGDSVLARFFWKAR
jgi:hypothetical protein